MTTRTMKDEKRLKIIQRVFQGEFTVLKAAVILGISERQCYHIERRVHQEGVRGVIHGNRGRPLQVQGRRADGQTDRGPSSGEAMYVDKLDGKISQEYFDRRSHLWREEPGETQTSTVCVSELYLEASVALIRSTENPSISLWKIIRRLSKHRIDDENVSK